ncbi:uncharacterized protein LOC110030716 [Phalaenopsis equestris]|uniref:uncharacterized protein LOC110030716 n=1 Tax=Phalaenopsis equestris TaxID=78828 RepID=UPI0009E5ED45|nr:uncharacterized protein LOC110030716 [Phalaenopsis equestris]XP_020589251.1 uncharacterized protein LOC110030716 [Phalaenopsis equestris]XP_020589252.1 uncharacterized protein LOC110030716 [Phalaenopsis equestris]XP_020589253.1 uncharacterized protein LOC110030716 [Phalaenopsis equestris]XP_020589254.1 uncharacterized protein LOC110030716 [Phalaenopsis equestris]
MASPYVVANSGSSSSIFLSASTCSLPPNLSPPKIANSHHLSPSFIDPPLFSSTTIPVVGSVTQVSSTRAMIYNTNISSSSERRLEGNDSETERLRSCDVYIGYCDRKTPSLKRFVNWLRAEMVMHGFSFFMSYLTRCSDARSHAIARTAMEEAALGVVIVTRKSFSSPWSIEELKLLLGRKKLIPIFFGLKQKDCLSRDIIEKKGEIWGKYGGTLWKKYEAIEEEWSVAVDGLSQIDVKFEVTTSNMRDCVLDAISFIAKKLGRGDALEKLMKWKNRVATEEFPFTRNLNFIGRKKEFLKLKLTLFGDDQMECDNDFINMLPQKSSKRNNELHQMKNKEKMKGQRVWKESKEEIVMAYEHDPEDFDRFPPTEETAKRERKCGDGDLAFGKGIACISGESGTGKTELLLEFAYRYSQMYKMVLWISGEEKYVRINYMNLMNLLGVDATIVDREFYSDGANPKHFEETEGEAIQKVRRELMRGIPYLLVIDNLENEKDWWDGRNIVDLLPRFDGESHVIISTQLPMVMNIQPLKLSNLSSAESLSLMTSNLKDLKSVDEVALKIIGERLCRLPLGLALVGGILSDYSIDPPKLLELISRMRQSQREMQQSGEKEDLFTHNPFLLQLLDFLFFVLNQQKKHGKLAKKMTQVCCWFASSPIPISLLAFAAELPNERTPAFFLKNCCQMFMSEKKTLGTNLLKAEAASSMLIGVNLARRSSRKGFISFHDIIRIYAYKRGGDKFASSMVRAISTQGCLPVHLNHIWAACFLIFKFSSMSTVANLSIPILLPFIRQFVLPLADHSFASLSQCDLIVDLLHRSTKLLESVENLILAGANSEEALSYCFASGSKNSILYPDPLVYQDVARLRAALLERRAKFMVLCGHYEIGEQLCSTALNIKEVINGLKHS